MKQQTKELTEPVAHAGSELQQQVQKQKWTEERLIKIQRLQDLIVNSFPDVAIGVLNREMRLALIDGRDLDEVTTGTSKEKKAFEEHYPHLDGETLAEIKKAFDGESVCCEIKTNDKFYKVTAMPLVGLDSRIDEVLCVMLNITEQKRMEEGLMKALEREKELSELKSRFVTMASHEFRTPLTSILASTFLLENLTGESYDREKSIHINRIKRSVNNLTTILNEFLSLEKLEENKVKLVHAEVNVPEFIQDDLISEVEVLKRAGQVIEYNHLGSRAMAWLDHQVFWSIVTNLLTNSLKYSRPDDKVVVTSEIRDNAITLTVTDQGIGIPPEEHKYIFGRFYRASNALNIEGTGLGLHIVQKYVHLLNGTISFDSELNKGTRFTVVLPDARFDAAKTAGQAVTLDE